MTKMPAKRLCDASSVVVGAELPISSRFQPSPLASKLLAASRKGEHCASVSPCQYIAYPQQVLCSAFSWRQVLLGTMRPQHWICKGEFVWPNGEAGGWGQEKSQRLLRRRRSYKNFSRCKMSTPRHTLAEESWLTRRQDRLQWQVCHTKKKKKRQGRPDYCFTHKRVASFAYEISCLVLFSNHKQQKSNDSFLKSCVHLQLFLQPRPNLYQELPKTGARNMLQNFYMWHDIFGSQ